MLKKAEIRRNYNMKKNRKKKNIIKPFVVGLCFVLTGCGTIGLAREAAFESAYENSFEEEEPADRYPSEAEGVVEAVDTENGRVTLYLTDRKEEKSFYYDGATAGWDRYGYAMTMEQFLPGEIVRITYNSELEKLGSMTQAEDSFSYEGIGKYALNMKAGTLQIGEDVYHVGGDARVFSGTRTIGPDEILKLDQIAIKGKGHEVFSILIEKGHGYLNLENDEAVAGGWIEVGQAVIQQINPDMLITVPEGSYSVLITANGIEEHREVTIERDKETVLNLSDIEIEQPTTGKVVFHIQPENAEVLIDLMKVDTSYTVILPLGLHKVTVSAEGYDSLSEYFEVNEGTTTVRMTLDEREEPTVSENKAEEKEAEITIAAPVGAEVYQDNLYMGIAPVTYKKTAGSHVITLRKSGYITRSYDIEVEEDDRDVTYSFPELDSEEYGESANGGREGSNTVSGNGSRKDNTNTVSGNKSKENGTESGDKTDEENSVSGNESAVSGNKPKNLVNAPQKRKIP